MNTAVLDALKARRSNRSFRPEQVSEEQLCAVLEAGTYAPTAKNRQLPTIVAVQNPATVAQLAQMNAAILGSDDNPYYGAPTILVVLVPEDASTGVEDGSCVLNTLLIAAHAAGLSGVWIHRAKQMFETAEGKALLKAWGLPQNLRGVGAVALGYPAEPDPPVPARKENYVVRA